MIVPVILIGQQGLSPQDCLIQDYVQFELFDISILSRHHKPSCHDIVKSMIQLLIHKTYVYMLF